MREGKKTEGGGGFFLSKLLDKHAPQKKIQIVHRPLNDWMNDDIQALKAIRRKKRGNLAKKSNCCQF